MAMPVLNGNYTGAMTQNHIHFNGHHHHHHNTLHHLSHHNQHHHLNPNVMSPQVAPSLSPIGAKLSAYYMSKSSNGRMELVILQQPEEQHRARYLTEGSRGAIKDMSGLGHPVVKLVGCHSRQPVKLECYIGHDKHNAMPHLFYQASKISGKNSTQCTACKVDGTSVIVMNLLPENDMQATIDCVGILKERNVDVEQKLLNLNRANRMIDFELSSSTLAGQSQNILHNGTQLCATTTTANTNTTTTNGTNNITTDQKLAMLNNRCASSNHYNNNARINSRHISNHIISQNGTGTSAGINEAMSSRKRSVRCRLVFRVRIPETGEVLQTISTPIICTQPLGTPEICKKSVNSIPVDTAGQEMFIIGKNFLKDSRVIFRHQSNGWIKVVEPDREYLNSTHLVCTIPSYDIASIACSVDNDSKSGLLETRIEVQVLVKSGGKFSEPNAFCYINEQAILLRQQQQLLQQQQQQLQQQQQQPQQEQLQQQQQQEQQVLEQVRMQQEQQERGLMQQQQLLQQEPQALIQQQTLILPDQQLHRQQQEQQLLQQDQQLLQQDQMQQQILQQVQMQQEQQEQTLLEQQPAQQALLQEQVQVQVQQQQQCDQMEPQTLIQQQLQPQTMLEPEQLQQTMMQQEQQMQTQLQIPQSLLEQERQMQQEQQLLQQQQQQQEQLQQQQQQLLQSDQSPTQDQSLIQQALIQADQLSQTLALEQQEQMQQGMIQQEQQLPPQTLLEQQQQMQPQVIPQMQQEQPFLDVSWCVS